MKKAQLLSRNIKFFGAITLMLFLMSSCGICIEGEGPEDEEMREMEAFTELEIDIDADVIVHIGDQPSVKISAQENLLSIISTDVRADKLTIEAEPCINSSYPINIDITTTSLSAVKLNGSADITVMDEIYIEDFDLKINGSGNITADIFTNELRIKINGSGNVLVTGSAKDADIVTNGSGDIRADLLQVYQADIQINGSGDASISVLNNLKVDIRGSGDVKYSGDPSIKTSISGSGSVTKVN